MLPWGHDEICELVSYDVTEILSGTTEEFRASCFDIRWNWTLKFCILVPVFYYVSTSSLAVCLSPVTSWSSQFSSLIWNKYSSNLPTCASSRLWMENGELGSLRHQKEERVKRLWLKAKRSLASQAILDGFGHIVEATQIILFYFCFISFLVLSHIPNW